MKLTTIILQVGDVAMLDRCRDWYLTLGLSKSPPDSPGESYWFDTGSGTSIGIHVGEPVANPPALTIGLEVEDIDADYARLTAAGFNFDAAPVTKSWSGRVANLHDPVGHTLQLTTYVRRIHKPL